MAELNRHQYRGTGLRNVGSYQISGHPYLSGTTAHANNKTKRFQFNSVSRELTVFNLSSSNNELKVHFVSGSATGMDFSSTDTVTVDANSSALAGLHFVPLAAGESVTFIAKCKEIYVTNQGGASVDYRILADLTGIDNSQMYHVTGSGASTVDGT